MELRHLRYFVAVAEAENVSRAALKLHVSQPALSRQIRDLEDEIGFALLERSAKSVRLTEAGRVFLPEARAVLQRASEAINAARTVAAGGGELNIGYAPSPTVRILPGILRAFQSASPKVRVRLHDLSTEEMLAGLREDRLNVALMVQPSPSLLRGCAFRELTRDLVCAVVAPKHPWARRKVVTRTDLLQQSLIALTRADYPDYHEMLDTLFAGSRKRPRIAGEHDSMASLIAAVEAGSDVALALESIGCIAGPRVKLIPLSPAPAPTVIGAVWCRDRLSPAAELLLECARTEGGGQL